MTPLEQEELELNDDSWRRTRLRIAAQIYERVGTPEAAVHVAGQIMQANQEADTPFSERLRKAGKHAEQ